jgi:hypothetical protein
VKDGSAMLKVVHLERKCNDLGKNASQICTIIPK